MLLTIVEVVTVAVGQKSKPPTACFQRMHRKSYLTATTPATTATRHGEPRRLRKRNACLPAPLRHPGNSSGKGPSSGWASDPNRRSYLGCRQTGSTLVGSPGGVFFLQLGEKGTPWHLWENTSKLSGSTARPLFQKTWDSRRPHLC